MIESKVEPIFILFLDAVHQLTKMNPLAFEFNGRYLAHIGVEVFTGRHFEFVSSGQHFPHDYLKDAAQALSVFDDIPTKKLKNEFTNKGFQSNIENLRYLPKAISYWEDYFGRFTPKMRQREQIRNADELSKQLCLQQMRTANEQLLQKVIASFEKFQKKRKTMSDLRIPKNVLDCYSMLVGRLAATSQGQLTPGQLEGLKTDFPDPLSDTDSVDEDAKFDSAVNRSSRVAIRKWQRPNKDEDDITNTTRGFGRPHQGGNYGSVLVSGDSSASENFFDFAETPQLGQTQGRAQEEKQRQTEVPQHNTCKQVQIRTDSVPFTTEYQNMFDQSDDSDEDMFAAGARSSLSSGVQKRPSNGNMQPLAGRRDRQRASLLPKRLEKIPESISEHQQHPGEQAEKSQPRAEPKKGGGMFNILDQLANLEQEPSKPVEPVVVPPKPKTSLMDTMAALSQLGSK